jgi:hypothetical protein
MTRYVKILEPDGTETGATFAVERVEGATTIRYDSRGTTEGTRAYRRGMVLLLQRLASVGATVVDAAIETRTTAHLSLDARRLPLRPPLAFPLKVEADTDEEADTIRAAFHTAAARAGRAKSAKGGGNGTKRLRIWVRSRLGAQALEATIAGTS